METQSTTTSSIAVRVAPRLLTDSRVVRLQLVEGASPGKVILRGEFARCDQATENKRVYSGKLWERELNRLGRAMTENKVFGELDHPSDGRTQLARVSHLLTRLEIKDGIVYGEAEVLDTERGRNLKAILSAGGQVGISSRGYGSTRTNEKGEDIVQDDYRLVTFDFVADPADQNAFPGVFYESKGNHMDNDQKSAEDFAKALEAAKSEGLAHAEANLREEFAQEVVRRIAEARSQIKEQVKGELLSDPSVGGARTALDKIKDVLRPFVLPEDAKAVAEEKDAEIATLRNQLATANLQIKDLQEETVKLAAVAKEAGYKFFLERNIAGDPDADLMRKLIGDVSKYSSAAELKSKLEALHVDMAAKRETERKLSEEIESKRTAERERKDRERTRALEQEETLREENEQLRTALDKSLEANKTLGLRVYAESRLANHPKAAKLRRIIESSSVTTKEGIDQILEESREPVRDTDSMEAVRSRVRAATRGGQGPSAMDEETPQKRPSNGHYGELGVSLDELRRLSGMHGQNGKG